MFSSLFPFLCFLHFNTHVQARVRVRRKKTKTIRVKRKKSGTITALAGDIEGEEGSKDGGLPVSSTEAEAEEEAVEDEGKRTHVDETRSNEKRRQEKIEDDNNVEAAGNTFIAAIAVASEKKSAQDLQREKLLELAKQVR